MHTHDVDSVPFSYYRGGTSKALFFHASDIPPPGAERDALLLRLMGSPDPMQIDGMGGTHPVTSKIAIIAPSKRSGIDVDYLFAQVSIKTRYISYDGGCGNISAAVGPFAINEGLVKVKPDEDVKEVSIWMEGTGTQLISHVPINKITGLAKEKGEYEIDGCPGTGAPILMDYKYTAGGAVKRGLLPTSQPVDRVTVRGKEVPVTICDIAHIIVFGQASDFGITGDESAKTLNANQQLIDDVREFRGRAAEMVGLVSSWEKVDEEAPNLPYVILLSESPDESSHVQARLFLDNHCHTSMAGAGATCTAACSKIQGSLVNQLAKSAKDKEAGECRVAHPLGYIPITVKTKMNTTKDDNRLPEFEELSFVRTARRIAKGELFIPEDLDMKNLAER